MQWPKVLNENLIEPLSTEERGQLLTGIFCILRGKEYTDEVSSGVRISLNLVREEIARREAAKEAGKLGGNPMLKPKEPEAEPEPEQIELPVLPVQPVKPVQPKKTAAPKPKETFDSVIESYTEYEPLRQALHGFVESRQRLHKPMTVHALQLQLRQLDKLAQTDDGKVETVNQAIAHGWMALYALKAETGPNGVLIKPESEQNHDLDEFF